MRKNFLLISLKRNRRIVTGAGLFLCFLILFQLSCYNYHKISVSNLNQLQQTDTPIKMVRLKTLNGKETVVKQDSMIKIQADVEQATVKAFAFKLTATQLVAPDQDLILNRKNITSAEVKEFSTLKTVLLVCGVLLAITGVILGVYLTPGKDAGYSN